MKEKFWRKFSGGKLGKCSSPREDESQAEIILNRLKVRTDSLRRSECRPMSCQLHTMEVSTIYSMLRHISINTPEHLHLHSDTPSLHFGTLPIHYCVPSLHSGTPPLPSGIPPFHSSIPPFRSGIPPYPLRHASEAIPIHPPPQLHVHDCS